MSPPRRVGQYLIYGENSPSSEAPASRASSPERTGRLNKNVSWEGEPPEAGAAFVERVAYALNLNQQGFAETFGLTPAETRRFWKAPKGQLPDVDADPLWSHVYDRICTQLAFCLAVREELHAKLGSDRKRRMARRLRYTER